jgi:L-ascorbate metabolism protein UlaG (beta-lactamase superfamily)
MNVTMIGHSTVLVKAGGKKILTDPYFGEWGNIAFKRRDKPAVSREELAKVDAVLVSHLHWDHIDGKYFRSLGDVPVFCPKSAVVLLRLMGAKNVTGMGPWESSSIDGTTVTAVPALHLAPTIGFVLESEDRRVYFAGDTFYRPFMTEIGGKFRLDAALLPVTTFRIPMTMGEKQAVKAVQALKPSVVIPIHLGIVPRSPLLRTGHTVQGFVRRLEEHGDTTRVVQLAPGGSHTV